MAAKKTRDVAVTNTVPEVPDYLPGQGWDELAGTADTVNGRDLAKGEILDALEGIPFLITRLTFRAGIRSARIDYAPAMVSVEAVIGSESVLKRRRVNMADLPFEPDDPIVFNDGSTGIYRQLVAYLAASGRIELPEGKTNGEYGATVYDLPPSEWLAIHAGEVHFTDDGFQAYTVNIRLTCPRGLRISEYQSEFNPAGGKTRYIA